MEPPQQEESPNKLGEWFEWLRRRRPALAAIAVVPIVATIWIAVAEPPLAPYFAFPCPLHRDASVAVTSALHESCSLEHRDRIDAVVRGERIERVRSDGEVREALQSGAPVVFRIQPLRGLPFEREVAPILVRPGEAAVRLAASCALAMMVVATVLVPAVRAGVPALLPLSLIHAVAGVGIVSAVAGATTSAFEIGDALARAALAGAVWHLALVFPQRRGIVEQFPELIPAAYLLAFAVSAVELGAVYRGSALSTLAQRLLLLLIALGVALLALGCFFTVRQSASHRARGQARALLGGLAFLSPPIALVWALGTPSFRMAAVTLLAALLPFRVGHALWRYEVGNIDASFRAALARALVRTLRSAALFVVLYALRDRLGVPEVLKDPTVLFTSVYCTLLPLDLLRALLGRRARALLVTQRVDWESLGREFAQRIAAQRSVEDIATAVGDAMRRGLGDTGVSILAADGECFHVIDAGGVRGFIDPSLAAQLAERSGEAVLDLNGLADLPEPLERAHDSGVCAFARAEANGRLVGCLALAHARRGRVLGSSEKKWVATVAGQAGAALAALQLEQELCVAERLAARCRMEAELAHDIGKPLGALELIARRLADHVDPDDPIVPQLRKITRLAAHVRELTHAALRAEGEGSRSKLEDLVQVACLEVRSLHGDHRVVVHELPDIGDLPPGFERLARVLVNLLDNALRASAADEIVELRVRRMGAFLELEIEDRGPGMPPDQLRRAFQPFTTFRSGGTGLGLAISRRIVAALGGSLTLSPRSDGPGLIALARLPLSQ